MLSR
jgi:hypothetical protein